MKKASLSKLNTWSIKYAAWLLIAPAAIVVAGVVIFPMLYALVLSFTDMSLLDVSASKFAGLHNYFSVAGDKVFWESLVRTVLFVTISLSLELAVGFAAALLFANSLKPHKVLKTLLMIPMMFAPVLVGFQFKWFFNDQEGFINQLISLATQTDHHIAWLIEPVLGFISIVTAEAWMSTPFMTLVLLAGLMSVPREPFEAATVDGASSWQQLRFITWPLVSPYIYVALIIRSLDISRSYDVVRIMTDGGPANRTELIWTYIYRVGINSSKFGMGCAMSYITVAVTLILTIYLFKRMNKAIFE